MTTTVPLDDIPQVIDKLVTMASDLCSAVADPHAIDPNIMKKLEEFDNFTLDIQDKIDMSDYSGSQCLARKRIPLPDNNDELREVAKWFQHGIDGYALMAILQVLEKEPSAKANYTSSLWGYDLIISYGVDKLYQIVNARIRQDAVNEEMLSEGMKKLRLQRADWKQPYEPTIDLSAIINNYVRLLTAIFQ